MECSLHKRKRYHLAVVFDTHELCGCVRGDGSHPRQREQDALYPAAFVFGPRCSYRQCGMPKPCCDLRTRVERDICDLLRGSVAPDRNGGKVRRWESFMS